MTTSFVLVSYDMATRRAIVSAYNSLLASFCARHSSRLKYVDINSQITDHHGRLDPSVVDTHDPTNIQSVISSPRQCQQLEALWSYSLSQLDLGNYASALVSPLSLVPLSCYADLSPVRLTFHAMQGRRAPPAPCVQRAARPGAAEQGGRGVPGREAGADGQAAAPGGQGGGCEAEQPGLEAGGGEEVGGGEGGVG